MENLLLSPTLIINKYTKGINYLDTYLDTIIKQYELHDITIMDRDVLSSFEFIFPSIGTISTISNNYAILYAGHENAEIFLQIKESGVILINFNGADKDKLKKYNDLYFKLVDELIIPSRILYRDGTIDDWLVELLTQLIKQQKERNEITKNNNE